MRMLISCIFMAFNGFVIFMFTAACCCLVLVMCQMCFVLYCFLVVLVCTVAILLMYWFPVCGSFCLCLCSPVISPDDTEH